MASDLELKLRLRADGNLKTELAKAQGAVKELGTASTKAGSQVAKGMETATKSARETEGAMRNAERAVKALGVSLAVGAIIRATVTQEAAIAQLEARIRSTGGAAGLTSRELQQFASSLQGVTTFGDEAILAMQGVLLSFTSIRGDVFKDATKAILDMSIAMGQDLKSSAVQVGRALNAPKEGLQAMTRVGVKFTDEQKAAVKAMVEMNDIAGAQAIILRELQVEFGGSAEAARDTLGGALTGLKNAFGDLLEARTGLTEAQESVESLTSTLTDPAVVEGINRIVSGVITLTGWLAKAAAEAVKLPVGLGEAAASFVEGPLPEQAQLRRQLEFFKQLKGADLFTRTRLFGDDGFIKVYDEAEITQRIAELKRRLSELGEVPGADEDEETEGEGTAPTPEELARLALEDDRRKKINADLLNLYRAQLSEISKMGAAAKQVADRFAQTREALSRRGSSLTAGTVLEPQSEIRAAEKAVEEGDFEKAGRAAERARGQIEALGEAGKASQSFLNNLLKRAEEAAQAAVTGQRKRLEDEAAKVKQVMLDAGVAAADLARIEVGLDLAAAMTSAETLKATIEATFAKPVEQIVLVRRVDADGAPAGDSPEAPGFSGGGMIRGPGGPTDDRVLLWGSNGEFMVQAAAVRHYGRAFLERLNAQAIPRYARGGMVTKIAGGGGRQAPAAQSRTGNPVTIVIDGQRFNTMADPDEAAAIARAAMKRGRRIV
jgi:hypothetical protein